jgi:hypothetical protein
VETPNLTTTPDPPPEATAAVAVNGSPARESERQYPTEWGTECPPDDAVTASGVVFRRVSNNPAIADDFCSYIESGHSVSAARLCEARGLSVFLLLQDAKAYADRYPDGGTLIAEAGLDADDGKMKSTPRFGNSHTTWWPFHNKNRHDKFRVSP